MTGQYFPSGHLLRGAICMGAGRARAAGQVGQEALLDAGGAEVLAWAAERSVELNTAAVREAMLALIGLESDFWNEPIPVRPPLPTSLGDLVRHALVQFGPATMWSMDRSLIAAHPARYWQSVVHALRTEEGPAPPFWIAEAIEAAATQVRDAHG